MAQTNLLQSAQDGETTGCIIFPTDTEHYFIYFKTIIVQPKKQTVKKPQAKFVSKVVITTSVNNRKQYIKDITPCCSGTKFVPHYTDRPENAMDFLISEKATAVISHIHPAGLRDFLVAGVTVALSKVNGHKVAFQNEIPEIK